MKAQPAPTSAKLDRRHFLNVCSAFGLGATLMPGVLWGMSEKTKTPKVTKEMIDEAATIAGIHIDEEHKEMMLEDLNDQVESYRKVWDLKLANSVAPALVFDPVPPGMKVRIPDLESRLSHVKVALPKDPAQIAFLTVRELAELLRTKKISSVALTKLFIERIKRFDPQLNFTIALLEERAMQKAQQADKEIAAGKYRGPLHGIPWGAKDLINVNGAPTTWGAHGFEEQKFDEDATVVQRLDKAGAVLVAKLTLGALAMGDLWFGKDGKGERTRNPWKLDQGSSGSSAGSASAVAAGCLPFAIGSETLGSISSPSSRCGTTGLRPTFGRVPRTGCMALSWSMDKLGPICRSVEDTAIVLSAIFGPDEKDISVHSYPFEWDAELDVKQLRIGYLKTDFEREPRFADNATEEEKARTRKVRAILQKFDMDAIAVMQQKLGWKLIPVTLPEFPYGSLLTVLSAEAGAAFDELTRSGRDKLLNAQTKDDWPNSFRTSRFIPAVEYINANRARTAGMQLAARFFEQFDVLVAPTDSGQLVMSNLTGHPAIILPHGFRPADAPAPTKITQAGGPGTPTSLTFIGNLFREAELLAVAKAYQDATDFHKKHPPQFLS